MPANIVVPEVGESIVDARVAKWLRKEGDRVSAGDPLVELETDKIDLEVGAPQAGVLSRIDRKDGEDVKVGEVLGVIDEAASPGARAHPAAAPPSRPRPKRRRAKSRATPTAKKAAEQNDVDISRVQGTGDAGRVMRRDVERAAVVGPRHRRPAPRAAERPRPPEPAKTRPARRWRNAARPAGERTKSACGCRSAARRSPGVSSRRRAPPRCSPPSTKST